MNLTIFKSLYNSPQFSSWARLNSFGWSYFIWSRNLFKVASNPSFFTFYTLFKSRTRLKCDWIGKSNSRATLTRSLQLPLLPTYSNPTTRRLRISLVKSLTSNPRPTLHTLSSWTVDYLTSIRSHKILGLVPIHVFRGDSTLIYDRYDPKLIRKKRYRRTKKGGVARIRLAYDRLHLFRKYVRGKKDVSPVDFNEFSIIRKEEKVGRRLQTRKAFTKPLPRFKPYRYLTVELPPRVTETSPILHFVHSSQTSFRDIKLSGKIPTLHPKSRLSLSPIPKLQSFFNLFHRRLPRRLQTKFRWLRYRTAMKLQSRNRRSSYRYFQKFNRLRFPNKLAWRSLSLSLHFSNYSNNLTGGLKPRFHVGFKARHYELMHTLARSRRRKREKHNYYRRLSFASHRTSAKKIKRRLDSRIFLQKKATFFRYKKLIGSFLKLPSFSFTRKRFLLTKRTFGRIVYWTKRRTVKYYFHRLRRLHRPAIMKKNLLTNTFLNLESARLVPGCKYFVNSMTQHLSTPTIRLNPLYKVTAVRPKVSRNDPRFSLLKVDVENRISRLPPYPLICLPYLPLHVYRRLTRVQAFDFSSYTTPDTIRVYPAHSFSFRRSDFFFTNLLLRPTPHQLDLIASRPISTPTFDYNVFPDANLIKVGAFRRLNRQKNLFNRRHMMFNALKAANLSSSSWARVGNSSCLRVESYDLPYLDSRNPLVLERLSAPYRNSRFWSRSHHRLVKIQRVRFKPGYGRIWREARTSIREIVNVPVRYQYRLTPKLHWLYLQDRKLLKAYTPATLDYLLLASHLIPDLWSLKEIVGAKLLYLNGSTVQNINLKIFINDFIQITVSLRFYLTWKWLRVWSETRQNRVNRIFYSKYRPSGTNRNYRFARPLPSWFFDIKSAYRTIPQTVEVDFFTLSIFVLQDKQPWNQTEPVRANLYDSTSLNMYNWKYIT